MIYLDYSATTPVNKEVLDTFFKVSNNYIGNPNSIHKLGVESKKLMDEATEQIANLFNILPDEVIYTSSGSESNNLAIKGICHSYPSRSKHIITTKMEHSSILETVNYMKENGYKVNYLNILENGLIDLEHLKKLLKEKPLIVTIALVNSEVGIKQPIEEIGNIIREISQTTIFHVDGTNAVGKIKINLKNIDLFSCSGHKFYGLKGIGLLIKKKHINLTPLIHGGKSTTVYRSGTPALGLIVSIAKSLRLVITNLDNQYDYVLNLNRYLIMLLNKIPEVFVNSNSYCIPHIVNISIPLIKPETIIHALEEEDIYITTQTACSKGDASLTLVAMHKSLPISETSLRISLSHLTTEKEIITFVKKLKNILNKLILKKGE
ncbi:MAG: cysteine desulfurase [Tenericutes bacterium]|nr:cysteine desulfurase [Mycoplasmatota bacterium]